MDETCLVVKKMASQLDGVISAGALQDMGVDRMKLYELMANGFLRKASHGKYALAEDEPDEYRIIQSRSDKLVFSHGTALFLHGMSDRVPHILDITVPQGDNITRIKNAYRNTRFHYCKKELWSLGITEAHTPQGFRVRLYDPERCICDIIRNKEQVDRQIFVQAVRDYFMHRCNPRMIIRYARTFRIEAIVRNYMEVLS